MVNRAFNKKVKDALSEKSPEVTKAQAEQMVLLAKMQFRKSSRKEKIGFGELMLYQIRMIGVRIWGIEIITMLCLALVLRGFLQDLLFFTPRKIALLLSCAVVMASMFLLPFLYRSARFKMMEIESAAYFSIRRILISRFFLFFGGEIVIAAAVCTMAYTGQFMKMSMLIYVLLPLLLTGDGLLFFLRNTVPEKLCRNYTCYAGALVLLLFIGYYAVPWMFDGKLTFLSVWSLVILLGYFICQCERIMKYSEETLYA